MGHSILSRSLSRQWLIAITCLLLIGSIAALNIISGYNTINTTAKESLANDARVVEVNLSRQIVAVDLALVSVRKDLPVLKSENNGKTLINTRLKAMSDTMAGVRTLFIFDAAATVTYSNREELVGLNFRDRAYYINAQQNPNPEMLYVSEPYTTVLGTFAITIVKVIPDEQGGFAGLVGATVDPNYFATVLDSVIEGPDMWASLTHEDGKLFMVTPTPVVPDGADVARVNSFYTRQIDNGQPNSITTENNPATGKEYMLGQSIIKPAGILIDKGFVVAVGRDMSAIFADWRRDALTLSSLFGVLVVATSLGLFVNQKRQRTYYRLMDSRDDERKLAEQKIINSEEKFRVISEILPVGIYVANIDGTCTFVNDMWQKMAGLTQDEALGDGWIRGIHPDDRQWVFNSWDIMVASKINWDIEYRFQDKHGKITIVHGLASPQIDASGKIIRYIGVNIDITERKQTEKALKKSEEHHRTILQTALDGFLVVDTQGNLLEVNDTYCRMSGYTREELLSLRIPDLEASETGADTASHMQKILKQGFDRFESQHRRKDGSVFSLLISAQYQSTDGGRVVAFLQDITESKRANEKQLATSSRLNLALRVSHAGVWDWNITDGSLEWSPQMFTIFGINHETSTASFQSWRSVLHPDDLELAENKINQALKDHTKLDSDYRIIMPDGEVHWMNATGEGEYDSQGNPVKMMGICIDITERKLAENKIKNSLAEKEIILKEIHHRVKNNMQVISSLLQLQSTFAKDKDDAQLFKDSQLRIQSMSLVYNKLYQSVDLAHISFPEYLNDLVADLMRSSSSNTGKITTFVEAEGVELGLDLAIPCGLIINEVISNSLKYAFPDGRSGEIRVIMRNHKGRIEMSLGDDGVGIPPEIDINTSKTLGRTLLQALAVHQLAGTLELKREHGTEYFISFPYKPQDNRV